MASGNKKQEIVQKEIEPLVKNEKIEKNGKSWKTIDKLREFKSTISIEPIIIGNALAVVLCKLAIQNLNLEKACRVKLGLGEEVCYSLIQRKGNFSNYEAEVQQIVSSNEAWKMVIQTAGSTLMILFMGAWCDRNGNRKMCILLPVYGKFLISLSCLLSTHFFNEISVEVNMIMEGFLRAVTGSRGLLVVGVYSYLSDIVSRENWTFRMGIIEIIKNSSNLVATPISGILLNMVGYYGTFGLASLLSLISIVYGHIYLKKTFHVNEVQESKLKPTVIMNVINMMKETVAVGFKKREGDLRKKIILTLIIAAIIFGPDSGERHVIYLFVRYRLKWDALKYSTYATYNKLMAIVGTLFCISLFSKKLGFRDSLLSLMSVLSKLIGSVYLVFVYSDFQMYMVPLLEILATLTKSSLRSMTSKMVSKQETGKFNSLLSLLETLGSLVFVPTYTLMYARTITVFSGSIFIFSALLTLPTISLLICICICDRKELKRGPESAPETNSIISDSAI